MNEKAEIKKKVQELSRSINRMRDELCIAVDEERYEDAARIRDEATIRQEEFISFLSESTLLKQMPDSFY